MDGAEPAFGLKVLLLIVFVLLIAYSFNAIMRKWLKVEKPKFFSYNHVNDKHKKIDLSLRGVVSVLLIIGYVNNSERLSQAQKPIFLLKTWVLLFAFVVSIEVVRAFMEWKYAENPKTYLVTVSSLVFLVIVASSIFMTDFYGIFTT